MKLINKTALVAAGLLTSGVAMADFSANAGWVSEYHFRGIFQKNSSAYGGLDFEQNGFYAGTWAADVGDGLEVDGYFGYGGEIEGFSYGVGFTGYYYTGDFDDTYQEINVSLGYDWLSIEGAFGEYENFDGPTQDYTYYAITGEYGGFYGKYAGFTQDFDGNYFEFGYGWDFEGVDLSVSLILADDDLIGDEDETIVFGIGKSFDLD
ncbi:MAG TPA: TorF family putative porin [Woeseiaceae bacterium]|nr:TorF family putative porin [Woeseiaceae bacterium]